MSTRKSRDVVGRSPREQVTSVERALSILELLAEKQQGLSTSDISRRAGIPKSSTSYLLRTLISRGYVRRDLESGQHTLGLRLLSLGGQAQQPQKKVIPQLSSLNLHRVRYLRRRLNDLAFPAVKLRNGLMT